MFRSFLLLQLLASLCSCYDIVVNNPKPNQVLPHDLHLAVDAELRGGDGEDSDHLVWVSRLNNAQVFEGSAANGKRLGFDFLLEEEEHLLEIDLVDSRDRQILASKTVRFQVGTLKDEEIRGEPSLMIMSPRDGGTVMMEGGIAKMPPVILRVATNGPVWKRGDMMVFVSVFGRDDGESEALLMYQVPLITITARGQYIKSFFTEHIARPGSYRMRVDIIRTADEEEILSQESVFHVLPATVRRKSAIAGISHVYVCHWAALVDRRKAMERSLKQLGLREADVTWITDYDRRTTTQAEMDVAYKFDERLYFERLRQFFLPLGYLRPPPARKLSAPEILVTMCHLRAYELIVAHNDETAMVLEDDTCFHSNFSSVWPRYLAQMPRNFDFLFIGSGIEQHIAETVPGQLVYPHEHPSSRTAGSYIVSNQAAFRLHHSMQPFVLVSDGELDYQMWLHSMLVLWAEPNLSYEGTREGNHFASVVQDGRSSSQHAAVITADIATLGWYVLESAYSTETLATLRLTAAQAIVQLNPSRTLHVIQDVFQEADDELKNAATDLLQNPILALGLRAALDRVAHSGGTQVCSSVLGLRPMQAGYGDDRFVSNDTDGAAIRAFVFTEETIMTMGVIPGSHKELFGATASMPALHSLGDGTAIGIEVRPGDVLLADIRLKMAFRTTRPAFVVTAGAEDSKALEAECARCGGGADVSPNSFDLVQSLVELQGMTAL